MIAADEDALICDLAQVYGIFNYKTVPVKLLATLSSGLGENSRIKMKINNQTVPQETLLLATMVDKLSFLAWAKTKNGQKNKDKPKSILQLFINSPKTENNLQTFDTAEGFEKARKRILRGGN